MADKYMILEVKSEMGRYEGKILDWAGTYDEVREKLAAYGKVTKLNLIEGITIKNGVCALDNSDEGVVEEESVIFGLSYIEEPYIILEGELYPQKINMSRYKEEI